MCYKKDSCYKCPGKYVMEALQPMVTFERYKAFDSMGAEGSFTHI
jgi:hypothetical protein